MDRVQAGESRLVKWLSPAAHHFSHFRPLALHLNDAGHLLHITVSDSTRFPVFQESWPCATGHMPAVDM